MKQKIVIAGGTGFIGQYLQNRFLEDGFEVVIIARGNRYVSWDDTPGITNALNNAFVLINLAGKPISSKFTEKNKKELIESRVSTTHTLGNAITKCTAPPQIWINASGAHIYGTDDQKPHTENDAPDNDFFPAIMAKEWEDAFFAFQLEKTRQIAFRISIVLGKNGGVLDPFLKLTKFGLGGKQGNGEQKFSWIHIEDFYRIIHFVAAKTGINGVINICSPSPVSNAKLMETLRKVMKAPIGLPAPAFAIKIGAGLIGIESDLILKSLWVMPKRLTEEAYSFKYPALEPALENIINEDS